MTLRLGSFSTTLYFLSFSFYQVLALVHRRGFTTLEPDPQFLVWDPPSKYLPNYLSGWLNVPVLHDQYISRWEKSPRLCLRVLMKPAAKQPARLGPILLHCGGPGSDATCALPLAWGKWFELSSPYLVGDPLSDDYDYWSISQRGMAQSALGMFGFPDTECPFKDETGDKIPVWPTTRCNGIDDLIAKRGLDEVLKRLDGNPDRSMWDFLNKIRTGADPQTFGMVYYNETYVRWLYRLVALEQNLCFNDPSHLVYSRATNRSYHLLLATSTVDLAYDIELVRKAIGAEKMSMYGVSYGTKVGSVWATLFPNRVHRLILDGTMGSDPDTQVFATWVGEGAEAVWTGLSAACDNSVMAGEPPERLCPAGPGVTRKLFKILMEAKSEEEKSIAAAFYSELATLVFQEGQEGVPQASEFMKCLATTYATGKMTDCSVQPSPDMKYEGIKDLEVTSHVLGIDLAGRMTEEALIAWWERAKRLQPIGLTQSLFPVVAVNTWPAIPRPDPPAGASDVAPLIIGNLHDGQTPYTLAQRMQNAFPRGRLLSSQFYGHGLQGPKDVRAVIDRYASEQAMGVTSTYDDEVGKLLCVKIALVYLQNGTLPRDYVCKSAGPINTGPGPAEVVAYTTTTTVHV